MVINEDDYFEEYEEWHDEKIEDAKIILIRELFEKYPEDVFYGRQIQVLFERQFFHWITAKALKDLVDEGIVNNQ